MIPEDLPAIEMALGHAIGDGFTALTDSHEDSGWIRMEILDSGGSSLGVVVRMSAGADWALEE